MHRCSALFAVVGSIPGFGELIFAFVSVNMVASEAACGQLLHRAGHSVRIDSDIVQNCIGVFAHVLGSATPLHSAVSVRSVVIVVAVLNKVVLPTVEDSFGNVEFSTLFIVDVLVGNEHASQNAGHRDRKLKEDLHNEMGDPVQLSGSAFPLHSGTLELVDNFAISTATEVLFIATVGMKEEPAEVVTATHALHCTGQSWRIDCDDAQNCV